MRFAAAIAILLSNFNDDFFEETTSFRILQSLHLFSTTRARRGEERG
jgi:hypothetical protein